MRTELTTCTQTHIIPALMTTTTNKEYKQTYCDYIGIHSIQIIVELLVAALLSLPFNFKVGKRTCIVCKIREYNCCAINCTV